MAFGSGDRCKLDGITKQLTDLTATLAALKQQVTDQQHTIDRIQQDANTGLSEILTVARDAMNRTTDAMTRAQDITTGPLAQIGGELAAIRNGLDLVDAQLRAAQSREPEPEKTAAAPASADESAAGPSQPEPEPIAEPQPEQRDDDQAPDLDTLRAAAGISAAALHAHRDTWEFLVKHAGADQHFHVPGAVTETAGIISVHLSGPSLVAILTSLDQVRNNPAASIGTQAIAHHIHQRIGRIVKDIADNPSNSIQSDPVIIRIDDRRKTHDDPRSDDE
ncbi:hypothetical protein ACFC09_12210 [Streptomyces sp. NPDC056161]|uniref:hypothetical protein n=1 Tax=Streptomyces sp. NPDC056161 TaxID=3345732 RepID=UPI0035DB290C